MHQIAPSELKAKLEAGEPIEVVDIREAEDYAAWHIHGSHNLPVLKALQNHHDEVLVQKSGAIPKGRPVVAVCRAGIVSQKAASILKSQGFEARSLVGGIRAWGGVWSEAPIALESRPAMKFFQIRRNGKGCLSYLFGTDTAAAVVDPCLEIDAYLEVAERENLCITQVLETHVHADHISRARDLCRATGAKLIMPPNERVNFAFTPLRDGEQVSIDGIALEAVFTPGHTTESTCYLVDNEVLLTGDTLFVNAVGRPDLELGDEGAESGARALHHSLHERLLGKFDGLRFYPGHHGKPIPFDGRPIGAVMRDVRSDLELLEAYEESFVDTILKSLSAKPPNYGSVVAINEGRADLIGVNWLDVEAGPNSCAAG